MDNKLNQFTEEEYTTLYMMFKNYVDMYNYYRFFQGYICHWDFKDFMRVCSNVCFITEWAFDSGLTIYIYKKDGLYYFFKHDDDDCGYNIKIRSLDFDDIEGELYSVLAGQLDTVSYGYDIEQ